MPQRKPKQSRYKVRRGDTLWDIARTMYGDPQVWPEISEANKLKDPDLILVGQELVLPDLSHPARGARRGGKAAPATPRASRPPAPHRPRRRARPVLLPFKYDLEGLPSQVVIVPPWKYETKITGDVTLQSERALETVTLTKDAVVTSYKQKADGKLYSLASEAKVKFDPATGSVAVSCELTSASKLDNGQWPATSVEVLPNGVKYSVKPRPVSFKYQGFSVQGSVGFEGTITRQDDRRHKEQRIPVPAAQPSEASKWIAIGLLLVAGTIVVVTIAEDVVTAGGGIADDPISLGVAARMAGRAMTAFRGPILVPAP